MATKTDAKRAKKRKYLIVNPLARNFSIVGAGILGVIAKLSYVFLFQRACEQVDAIVSYALTLQPREHMILTKGQTTLKCAQSPRRNNLARKSLL